MNNQTLVIYDFKVLYEILSEIENHLNFNLIKINTRLLTFLLISIMAKIY